MAPAVSTTTVPGRITITAGEGSHEIGGAEFEAECKLELRMSSDSSSPGCVSLKLDRASLHASMAKALREAADAVEALPTGETPHTVQHQTIADIAKLIFPRALDNPARVLLTGPTQQIAVDRLSAIHDALPSWAIRERVRTLGLEGLELIDGTRVYARSRRSRGYARGHTYDLVILDEHTTATEYADVAPTVATTGGRLLTIE